MLNRVVELKRNVLEPGLIFAAVVMQAVHESELTPLQEWGGDAGGVIAVAAKFGDVRLIDNMLVEGGRPAVR